MDIQTRRPVLGNSWRSGASKPAGLYGELTALPAHPPARTAPVAGPLRKHAATD